MNKLTKSQVRAAIKRDGKWVGKLLPCKANPHSPWFSGGQTTLTAENFDRVIGEFEYYNCNAETGRYTAFYEEESV